MIDNKLLKRQLKKSDIDLSEDNIEQEKFLKFLKMVENSYNDYDIERKMTDHSIEVSSAEMREAINELEKAHRDAEKKDKMMFQQSRLAQMGEMISMIAHQWRQPLNVIAITVASLELEMMMSKEEQTTIDIQEIIDKLQSITKHVTHLGDTIEDFRNFFKPTKEKEVTNFCQQVETALNIIGASLDEKKISVVKDMRCKESFATFSNELKHVVINLIKNAEDALIENKIKEPVIYISTYKTNKNRIMKISDNAGGIPPNIMGSIFDPYFSTKIQKNGTGLGLYMSKIIIEDHCGGKLSVRNNKEGAEFKIALPLFEATDPPLEQG